MVSGRDRATFPKTENRIDQNPDNCGLSKNDGNINAHMRETKIDEISNKCNQCDFTSAYASNLKMHLKIHSRERTNKCNKCDVASIQAGNLRIHLELHCMEKLNKCNQCDRAFSRTHTMEKSQTNAINVTLPPIQRAV